MTRRKSGKTTAAAHNARSSRGVLTDEARPVPAAEMRELERNGTLARIAADLAERCKIGNLSRALGDAWNRRDVAEALERQASNGRQRKAAQSEVRGFLDRIAALEAELAEAAPRSADDALVLAVLLADRIAAIEPRCDGDSEAARHHVQARKLAASLISFMSCEARSPASEMGLRAYSANVERQQ